MFLIKFLKILCPVGKARVPFSMYANKSCLMVSLVTGICQIEVIELIRKNAEGFFNFSSRDAAFLFMGKQRPRKFHSTNIERFSVAFSAFHGRIGTNEEPR